MLVVAATVSIGLITEGVVVAVVSFVVGVVGVMDWVEIASAPMVS